MPIKKPTQDVYQYRMIQNNMKAVTFDVAMLSSHESDLDQIFLVHCLTTLHHM